LRRASNGCVIKKLWKLLIDRDMRKKDLCIAASISLASVTKMGKGGTVNTSVLEKIYSIKLQYRGHYENYYRRYLCKGV